MNGKNMLYLGSHSQGRQALLSLADIPYKVVGHTSDERGIDSARGFEEYVAAIARDKMDHIDLAGIMLHEGNELFALTADTLVQTTETQQILGKPQDLDDAKRMLRIVRGEPVHVCTACVLEKKIAAGGSWKTIAMRAWNVSARIEFCVDEALLDTYFKKMPMALSACSGGIIEGYGHNFLRSITGSYSAVLGLPMFELRHALSAVGFGQV